MAIGDYREIRVNVEDLLARHGLAEAADQDDMDAVCETLMRAEIEAAARCAERSRAVFHGEPADPLFRGQPLPGAGPVPVPASAAAPPPAGPVTTDPAPAVSAGAAPAPRRPEQAPDHADESPVAYVERIIREKDLKPKTAEKYRVAARTLEDMCGAKKMWQYTIRDAILYKDRMQEVPARATSMRGPETRTLRAARRANARLPGDQQVPVPEHARPSMRQAREDNLRRPEPERLPVLKRETINSGYITFLRQLWDFAVGNRGAEVNIFKDVRVVSKKTARARGNRRKRRPFSIAEVNLILSMPLFTGSRSAARPNMPGIYRDKGWRFWLPLLMLFTGMRPEEAGQLLVTDLKEQNGWPCLHVTTVDTLNESDSDFDDRPDDKHLKTAAADRLIPLHPVLIDCGFVHHVQAARARGDARIFSDWRKGADGTYSDTSSKFFNREHGFLDRAKVKTALTALYSLRHTFKDAIRRAGLNDQEQDLLMGHASEGVRGIYGSRELYPALVEKLKAVAYEGVDFTPLRHRCCQEMTA